MCHMWKAVQSVRGNAGVGCTAVGAKRARRQVAAESILLLLATSSRLKLKHHRNPFEISTKPLEATCVCFRPSHPTESCEPLPTLTTRRSRRMATLVRTRAARAHPSFSWLIFLFVAPMPPTVLTELRSGVLLRQGCLPRSTLHESPSMWWTGTESTVR